MYMENKNFNLTSLLVLVGILLVGLVVIYFFSWREARRLKREMGSRYPSATRKYPSMVDSLLKMDNSEHNN